MNTIAVAQGKFDKALAAAKEYPLPAVHHDRRVFESTRKQSNILPSLHYVANVSWRRIFNISKPITDDRKYREPKYGARNHVSELVLKHFGGVNLLGHPSLGNFV